MPHDSFARDAEADQFLHTLNVSFHYVFVTNVVANPVLALRVEEGNEKRMEAHPFNLQMKESCRTAPLVQKNVHCPTVDWRHRPST